MAVACAWVASAKTARGRCIGLTSFPEVPIWLACQTMGLGTFSPPCAHGERLVMDDTRVRAQCRFGCSSPASRKTSVSCVILTTVPTNVQVAFPYPLPRHPCGVLLAASHALAGKLRVFRRRMAIHGFAQLDYSFCTHGRGHFVPEVVSVRKQDTSGGVAVHRPEHRLYVYKFKVILCNS